jgi:uncharacterized protein YrrD
MHILLNSIIGFSLKAVDGEIGRVHDFYFDDSSWTIRYLVVRTGGWFSGRMVLIPSKELGRPDWERHQFCVNLTCAQVKESPDIDTAKPVYRQQEIILHDYYQWLPYWKVGVGGSVGPIPAAQELASPVPDESGDKGSKDSGDPHLRSTRHIRGYYIHARDGNLGHVDDYIVDDSGWKLEYLIADTRNIFPGKKVMLAVKDIEAVEWLDYSVHMALTKEEVRRSPEFNAANLEFRQTAEYWIALPSKIRHNKECKFYHNTKNGYFTDEKEGTPCSLCGG